MRQRDQQHSENSSTTFIVTAKRAKHKGGMIVLIFLILNLVCRVGAKFPCKPAQIHWNSTKDRRYKCLECPDCPAGSQPSVACGSSVKYGTHVDCVLCEPGKTFSDKYDNAQCMSCTICPKGKAVTSNCTLATNTNCENKCGYGFYTVPLISSCLPCTQCCDDEKDELAKECVNHKKKCKVRYTPCTPLHTTPSKPSEKHSTSNIFPTTLTATLQVDTKSLPVNEAENLESDQITIRITPMPTWSLDHEALRGEKTEEESPKQDGTGIVMILFMVILALCVVLSVLVILKKFIRVRDMLRSSREQNSNNEGNETSEERAQSRPNSSASYQSNQESVSLLLSRSGSPQPNDSASSFAETVPRQPNEYASSQAIGSASYRPQGTASPQPNGSQSTLAIGSVLSQATGPVTHLQPESSVLPQPDVSELALRNYSRSSQEQDRANSDDMTLEELEEKHFPVFEQMCKELNIRKSGERWDFERLAFCYDRISPTDRKILKNEFQNNGGIPSDVLMSHIKATYPGHPLRNLVRNLQSIGRNDIADRLMIRYTEAFINVRELTGLVAAIIGDVGELHCLKRSAYEKPTRRTATNTSSLRLNSSTEDHDHAKADLYRNLTFRLHWEHRRQPQDCKG